MINAFFWILVSTFLISLISFVGALILFLKEKLLNRIISILVSFSAGALLGASFFSLIPEAIKGFGNKEESLLAIFAYLVIGFCLFFILEQFIKWHHHHTLEHPEIMPFSYLILLADGLHNFIDGLVVAGSFLISFPVGLITSLGVALHEIPQEIGDFAVLIYGGVNKRKALCLNFISAVLAVLGGIIGFFVFKGLGPGILFLLPFTAGGFIYIASSDLLPQIKEEKSLLKSLIYFFVFILALIFLFFINN